MTRILIIGANGVLGSAASKHFASKGFPVRCFVRNKEKAADLQKAGAEIIEGDLTNANSIPPALKNVDVVLTAAHGLLGKGKNSSANVDKNGHIALIKAAVDAGVNQFIYTSVHGASADHPIDFMRSKFEVEQELKKSGLNYTILRMPSFMEWHAHNLLGKSIIDKGKVTILGKGDNPTNFIAVNDVVRSLDIIVGNEDYYKKVIHLAGPENFSKNDVAAMYGRSLNISPKVGHVPVGALKVLSAIIQPFHPGIARVMRWSAYNDTSDSTMDPSQSIQQFGLEPTRMEEFIRGKCQKI